MVVERSISNKDWLRGLILNILNTRARTDLKCPSPAAVFGHWSESYRHDNLYIGARMWNAAAKSYRSDTDAINAIGAAVKADMAKLLVMKVVDSVEVAANYAPGRAVVITIATTIAQARHVLSLSGSLAAGNWAWK